MLKAKCRVGNVRRSADRNQINIVHMADKYCLGAETSLHIGTLYYMAHRLTTTRPVDIGLRTLLIASLNQVIDLSYATWKPRFGLPTNEVVDPHELNSLVCATLGGTCESTAERHRNNLYFPGFRWRSLKWYCELTV